MSATKKKSGRPSRPSIPSRPVFLVIEGINPLNSNVLFEYNENDDASKRQAFRNYLVFAHERVKLHVYDRNFYHKMIYDLWCPRGKQRSKLN